MTESFGTAGKDLAKTCLVDLSMYKRTVKILESQAVRRLVESIIAQKIDQLVDLRTLTGSPVDSHMNSTNESSNSAEIDGIITEKWPNPESLLKDVTSRENAFAEAIRAVAIQAGSDEHRNALNACAERSRKFASWTQDHLDLLSLF